MMSATPSNLLQHVHKLFAAHAIDQLSDRQLLARFHAERDDSMFALLIRRHGPMVLSVCRRVIGHEQDAEDAFQAVFLILARKAGSIRQAHLGGYLYRVAYHVALRARARAAKHKFQSKHCESISPFDASTEINARELQRIVDEELLRLPDAPRAAVVLCHLEGKTQEEAARLLGWSKGTLRRRLDKGREILRRRLAARGLAPATALTATIFADGTTPASVSPILAEATMRMALSTSAAPPAIAALVEGGIGFFGLGNTKAATTIVLLLSLLSGMGLWACSGLTVSTPQRSASANPPDAKASAQRPAKADKDALILCGRVLGPDKKPIAGAKLYLAGGVRGQESGARKQSDAAVVQRGTTDADGRFRLELSRKEARFDRPVPLLAVADGFGLNWIDLGRKEAAKEFTLRLVKDVPIRGRLVSTEGKPMPGVKPIVRGILAVERMDDFLRVLQRDGKHADEGTGTRRLDLPLQDLLGVRPTDKDGRFEIHGVGAERFAALEVKSGDGPQDMMIVITRTAFDSKAFQKGILARGGGREPPVYGPSFEHVVDRAAKSSKFTIEGAVRESGSHKPVAGATVSAAGATAVTDAQGRYKLIGSLNNVRGRHYTLFVAAPKNAPLLGRQKHVTPGVGPQPFRADVELPRGGVVTGRVYDKATGKGVPKCWVYYYPLPDNKTLKTDGLTLSSKAEEDGRYRLVALPGPGVLTVQTGWSFKLDGVPIGIYKPAEFDAADRPRIKISDQFKDHPSVLTANGSFTLDLFQACKVVDVNNYLKPMTCDLALDPGKTLLMHIQDTEGKPLAGALVAGVSAETLRGVPLKTDSCRIYALDPGKPRPVVFLHAVRKLAAVVKLRGDEKEPVTIRLKPTGVLLGRVLDAEGQPVAGAEVYLGYASQVGRQLTRSSIRNQFPRTDKDGRFRLEGIVPGLKLEGIRFIKSRQMWETRKRPMDVSTPEPGKTLDLGDIRTKSRRL